MKLLKVIGLWILVVGFVIGTNAQEELTETYIGADFEFQYPGGWLASEQDGIVSLTSSDVGLVMSFLGPQGLTRYTRGANSAADVLENVAAVFTPAGEMQDFPVGERDGALIAITNSNNLEGVAVVVEFSGGGYGLMIAFTLNDEDFSRDIASIVSTFNSIVSSSTVSSLNDFDEDWETVIAELEAEKIIGAGGALIFEEDYAFFSGQGNWFTALARNRPNTDIVMGAEITYRSGSSSDYESCSILARIVTDAQGSATKYLEVGIDNTNALFYFDRFGTGQEDFNTGVLPAQLTNLTDPIHVLFIASGDVLKVYINGQPVLNEGFIEERSGSFGIALRGKGPNARCEGRNIWAVAAPIFEEGVCKISAANAVNKRTGPGTNFDRAGQMSAGSTDRAIGRAEDNAGFTWWQLESDDNWVREDVVTAQGDCLNVREADQ